MGSSRIMTKYRSSAISPRRTCLAYCSSRKQGLLSAPSPAVVMTSSRDWARLPKESLPRS